MRHERRKTPRWKAASHRYPIRVRRDDGRTISGVIVDISVEGLGLRIERLALSPGMSVRILAELLGEAIDVRGVVRFVDRFFPRAGLQVDAAEIMGRLVARAETGGFLMAEGRGDTLALAGSLTLAARKELDAAACYRSLDLSRIATVSIAGAGIVSAAAGRGTRIECCSAAIAPLFDSLGICRAGLCVSPTPCDLPKAWPTGRATAI